MKIRVLATIAIIFLFLGASAAWSVTWQTTAFCNFNGSGGDLPDRGIYVTGYPGNNLSQVQLGYSASSGAGGLWSISLTARRGAYNGPQIGETQIATPIVPTSGEALVVFDFGGAPVTPGETITFTQTAQPITASSGSLFFDTGKGSCPGVFETNETTPPLDTVRRDTVGIVLTEHVLSGACIPSDTVMCIDNFPGDHRFKVTVHFHTVQGGGVSGNGQEIPMAPLGVTHGGLFWFFSADNPEMLVKVIDGCTVNGRFWVFLSAGTNVGFSVTVTDTAFGGTKTYTNNDLTPAVPVQDTSAISGCV
ncbi:MAG TPA: hypothetical protein VMW75_09970 [Thermoanaerobaculia bacterium]|nr:hypothetical protein [Thermoanaerobaculia bacterium]